MNDRMDEKLVSKLRDPDMQGAAAALLRAGRRAREIARQTNTAVVVVRDGKLVEERDSAEMPALPPRGSPP